MLAHLRKQDPPPLPPFFKKVESMVYACLAECHGFEIASSFSLIQPLDVLLHEIKTEMMWQMFMQETTILFQISVLLLRRLSCWNITLSFLGVGSKISHILLHAGGGGHLLWYSLSIITHPFPSCGFLHLKMESE